MTTILTVTKSGKVTLDRAMLDHLGVKPGESLAVKLDPQGRVSLSAATPEAGPSAARPHGRIEDTFGMLNAHHAGPPLTIEAINAAIEDAWAGKRSA
ncbi:AbrB/MazE/SpoVT family DNA-binding domain-containing protein [Aurantimonas aggregata]|uniref:AbrB/MazE/SpoVT family DNA-binding domain-containing protein n=1 Tax=Aurantimonas aggregata TaxID=2047720 RepID=A0A6L9MLX3_9HYPH|nr:AbrB/MazE/SpoVT family DNA-binding domain-containing protein [Aurantimonas aggregata]NDV88741.1 AbrB/MazE/SpoVT family DNA-binding domain-containing protein [Aurantimonas aggregata]